MLPIYCGRGITIKPISDKVMLIIVSPSHHMYSTGHDDEAINDSVHVSISVSSSITSKIELSPSTTYTE